MARDTKKTSQRTTVAALPAALAKRATAAAAGKRARLLRAAREQLALIARRKSEVTEAFYDIGVALGVLRQREMTLLEPQVVVAAISEVLEAARVRSTEPASPR